MSCVRLQKDKAAYAWSGMQSASAQVRINFVDIWRQEREDKGMTGAFC
jgi:hypothetical protein